MSKSCVQIIRENLKLPGDWIIPDANKIPECDHFKIIKRAKEFKCGDLVVWPKYGKFGHVGKFLRVKNGVITALAPYNSEVLVEWKSKTTAVIVCRPILN